MKILQINVRATQGGAGRVALDLHRRLQEEGIESRLLYGYASGIKDDPMVAEEPTIERLGTRPTVLFNYGCHRIFGWDPLTGNRRRLRNAISAADIVHLHAVHHHFLCWDDLIGLLYESGKQVIATSHDWWAITGRCGFTEECREWRRGCGHCGPMRFRDPKSFFDFSRIFRRRKVNLIRRLGNNIRFVCPAEHLASDYRAAFPELQVKVIPNWIDLEFERELRQVQDKPTVRKGILFSAADLSADIKIDRLLVDELALFPQISVGLVGRNNPFKYHQFEVFGEVHKRKKMVEILRKSRALVFCSRTDISPLTIIEALSAGCYVLAYSAPASLEILSKVGGDCLPDREAMKRIILDGHFENLYGGQNSVELARRAQAIFGAQVGLGAYIDTYKKALETLN